MTSGSGPAGLTIGELASRCGLSVAALRAWEQRYGFPVPARLGSGHRRYSRSDVELVLAVMQEREAGYELRTAIARVAGRPADHQPLAMYPALRRARPDLTPYVLSERTMHAISRAIEDECCAQAAAGVLVAGFQTERAFRASAARWTDLARTAAAVLVFAEFSEPRWRPGTPAELPLPADSPQHREWGVICDAPGAAACLLGVEQPGQPSGRPRTFEAIWTAEPDAVRLATRTGLGLARSARPDLVAAAEQALGPDPDRPTRAEAVDAARRATALTNRVIAYLQPNPTSPTLTEPEE